MSWTEEQVKDAVTKVIEKSSADQAFRALVVSDVYAAIKEATGREVPKEFKLNVVDGAAYHATIVLPAFKESADELSETELESVAGGSKSGATDFFNGVGNAIVDTANHAIDTAGGVANNAINSSTGVVNNAINKF